MLNNTLKKKKVSWINFLRPIFSAGTQNSAFVQDVCNDAYADFVFSVYFKIHLMGSGLGQHTQYHRCSCLTMQKELWIKNVLLISAFTKNILSQEVKTPYPESRNPEETLSSLTFALGYSFAVCTITHKNARQQPYFYTHLIRYFINVTFSQK